MCGKINRVMNKLILRVGTVRRIFEQRRVLAEDKFGERVRTNFCCCLLSTNKKLFRGCCSGKLRFPPRKFRSYFRNCRGKFFWTKYLKKNSSDVRSPVASNYSRIDRLRNELVIRQQNQNSAIAAYSAIS